MSVRAEMPPENIYARCVELFGCLPERVAFAYAPDIYNPSGHTIPEEFIVHEQVHIERQGSDPSGWWERYLTDEQFRLDEEVAAFRAQAMSHPNKRARRQRKLQYAKALADPMYGGMVSFPRALELLA